MEPDNTDPQTVPWPTDTDELHNLLRAPRFLVIHSPSHAEMRLKPGMLFENPSGFGVLLPSMETPFDIGVTLTITLGKQDGIYFFDCTLLHWKPLPQDMRFGQGGQVAVCTAPSTMCFTNRRATDRIPLHIPLRVWPMRHDRRTDGWMTKGEQITGQLLDLSTTGCQLHTHASHGVGDHLFLEMHIDDEWFPVEAICRRVTPGWSSGTTLGLQFLALPPTLENRLQQTLVSQQ